MSAIILDGKAMAEKIERGLAKNILTLKKRPGLAAVLVGDNMASALYVILKEQAAYRVGIDFHKYLCNSACYDNISEKELLGLIKFLNDDADISGIIVQLPLPDEFDTQKIINAISPQKDVDGFHPKNKSIVPPTVNAILELLKATKEKLENKKTLIIGNSDIFLNGLKKHLSTLGIKKITDSRVIPADAKSFDIIIIALGQAGALKKNMVKPGAIVIDAGISKVGGKTVGDVDPKVAEMAGYLSPVPGGVGPLTVAFLLQNTYLLSQK